MSPNTKFSRWRHRLEAIGFPFLALALSLLIGSLIIVATSSTSPWEAYREMWRGAFGSWRAFDDSLIKAVPFIFTALSFAIAKRCGIINLGGEGQFAIGALAATIVAVTFPNLPLALHLPLTLLAGFLGGACYGLIVAVLKIRFGASELITTIMMNYIAAQIISFFVSGPIMDSASSSYPQSAPIPSSAKLPAILPNMRLHWGLVIALLAVLFYYFYLWKTTKGFEMRIAGFNPGAGAYAGMNIGRASLRAMFFAGAFAGLGGCIEIIAVQGRLMMTSFAITYGFTGIAVALMGNNLPLGLLFSGLLFGGLQAGALRMQTMTDASSSVVLVIQALVILFVTGRSMFHLKRLKRRAQPLDIYPEDFQAETVTSASAPAPLTAAEPTAAAEPADLASQDKEEDHGCLS